jgi:hypothetical protein
LLLRQISLGCHYERLNFGARDLLSCLRFSTLPVASVVAMQTRTDPSRQNRALVMTTLKTVRYQKLAEALR